MREAVRHWIERGRPGRRAPRTGPLPAFAMATHRTVSPAPPHASAPAPAPAPAPAGAHAPQLFCACRRSMLLSMHSGFAPPHPKRRIPHCLGLCGPRWPDLEIPSHLLVRSALLDSLNFSSKTFSFRASVSGKPLLPCDPLPSSPFRGCAINCKACLETSNRRLVGRRVPTAPTRSQHRQDSTPPSRADQDTHTNTRADHHQLRARVLLS